MKRRPAECCKGSVGLGLGFRRLRGEGWAHSPREERGVAQLGGDASLCLCSCPSGQPWRQSAPEGKSGLLSQLEIGV